MDEFALDIGYKKYLNFLEVFFMSVSLCVTPNSYSVDEENMLLENRMDSDGMPHQISAKSKKKKWRVVRSYRSKFSCMEAIEKLIEIHSHTKER